jgi:hypothetical protein
MNGIGTTPLGPVEGTWVVGFFRDGEDAQEPVVMGTIGGVPQDGPRPDLARGTDTRSNTPDTVVPTANGGSFSEPSSPYAAEYPFNHVRESESGHVEEWDDTAGAERLRREHRKGTFEEIHPDGSKVTKVVGDDYEIVIDDKNVHVKGSCNITVDGNSKIYTKGNSDIQVGGTMNMNVGGPANITSGGDMTLTAPNINLNS